MRRRGEAPEARGPAQGPPGVEEGVSLSSGMFALEPRAALAARRWREAPHRAVLHQSEAGAKVSQADVAVHVQQDVVGLDVPERRGGRAVVTSHLHIRTGPSLHPPATGKTR